MNNRRISVLQFTNGLVRGGAEEHILTLLKGLDRNSFRLYLVCPPDLASQLGGDIPSDVTVFPLLLDRPTHFTAARQLGAILRHHNIDVLHAHMFSSSMFSAPIGRLCRVPLIIETTHVRENWRRGFKAYYCVDRFIARFIDRFIAVSNANAEYLIDEKGIPVQKVAVIQNGVDLDWFDATSAAPSVLRNSLGLDPNHLILVTGARLEPQKGHSVLLEAMCRVIEQFPQAQLVCVGAGGCRSALEEQTRKLRLTTAVRFVGYQANMPEWLALADIAVLPSLYEGLPLFAIEALAARRPVVATNVDGTPDVVVNEKTGLIVPPGDADALATAIMRLLDDTALRLELGCAGRRWVEGRFDRRIQIRHTEELYLRGLFGTEPSRENERDSCLTVQS
jgi:glycosyltransferase involved in cell wall biosynthesis